MTQPISSSLVVRAAASYLKPVVNRAADSGAEGSKVSSVLDRSSGPAFVIELSSAAKQHIGDGARRHAPRLGGEQNVGNVDDDLFADDIYESSFGGNIGTDGSGRREAPLLKSDGPVAFKPAGSIIDVRI